MLSLTAVISGALYKMYTLIGQFSVCTNRFKEARGKMKVARRELLPS